MFNKKNFMAIMVCMLFFIIISNVVTFRLAKQDNIKEDLLDNLVEIDDNADSDYNLFFDIVDILSKDYLEELNRQKLLEGAIEGMLKTLDDPQTTFLTPEDMSDLFIFLEGSFGGIGIRIVDSAQGIAIVEVFPDTPAEKEGLQPGDLIRYVGHVDVKDYGVDRTADMIRGEKGSEVSVSIQRPGSEELIEFTVRREQITSQTVTGEWLEPGVGYISISQFDGSTGAEFIEIFEEMEDEGMEGLILDLRDNPGGILYEALKVAEVLVPEGEIVRIVDREGLVKEIYHSYSYPRPYPMAVLINGGSASGSEIIAGALQDHEAAVLVGEPTFGKATVQHFETFASGNGLRYTVAKYVTPSGYNLHGQGLIPDYEIEVPPFYKYYNYFIPGKMEKGDFGQSVYLLQEILEAMNYEIKPTGYFDGLTKAVLEEFQEKHLLNAHGKFDDITWVYLRLELDKVIREEDYQLEKALQTIKDR